MVMVMHGLALYGSGTALIESTSQNRLLPIQKRFSRTYL